jgi:hypothetical protein
MLFDSLGMHANTPRNCSCCFFSISVHITCCMTSTNPYGTACSSLLSEIRTSLCFGMHSLLRKMLSLFSARPLSCSLLFSQQECLSSSCSLNKNASTSLFLASHQELLLSQQDCCCIIFLLLLASHQEPLGLSPRFLQLLNYQEWVHPFPLINLMREGEEFSNLTAEFRLDGWLRFGVSSLTLTSIIKLSFNLHLTN